MRFNNAHFFNNSSDNPKIHPFYDKEDPTWPITIKINSSEEPHDTPSITIFMNVSQFWALKNAFDVEVARIKEEIDNGN